MPDKNFLKQLGIGISSLTFGVALSIFIYAVASEIASGLSAWLLLGASFLLMLRFWWRYNELFVQYLPSKNFWSFLLDFAISFFGILAVLLVNNIQLWALAGIAAMLASMLRCKLSWKDASNKDTKKSLKMTFAGSVIMLAIMAAVFAFSYYLSSLFLSAGMLILIIIFVAYASRAT